MILGLVVFVNSEHNCSLSHSLQLRHKAHVKQGVCENLSGTEPLSQDFKPQRQVQCIQI